MLRNHRFYILLFSIVYSISVYAWIISTFQEGTVQLIRLSQTFALSAVTMLYVTLLIGPLLFVFPNMPQKEQIKHSRRALGVAAFYFAFLHASISFFKLLGGFEGLVFLSDRYLFNATLGFLSLTILFVLAVTSFDAVIKKMTFPKWKLLHRLVYAVGMFIVIHALMLGSHFRTFNEFIPQLFFAALAFLLFLEAMRFDGYLQKKFGNVPKFGLITSLIIGCIIAFYASSIFLPQSDSPLSVHNQHIQLAKEIQQGGAPNTMAKLPGMDGDKTKRYTTSFLYPESVQPQRNVTLSFPVYDAASGNRVQYFKTLYEKPAHLIVVDSSLSYFSHIHPEPTEEGFVITTQFPKAGEYHLYLDYQPLGAIEQQMAFTLNVGEAGVIEKSAAQADSNFTKMFGAYQVTLGIPRPLKASKLSVGQQLFNFTIKDRSGKPVTTLKPYLASFGHLVMINRDTYEYLHVHPTNLTPPAPNANGGPEVTFMPLGIYSPIKPGIYRVFGQFNPNNELFTADFTVVVE